MRFEYKVTVVEILINFYYFSLNKNNKYKIQNVKCTEKRMITWNIIIWKVKVTLLRGKNKPFDLSQSLFIIKKCRKSKTNLAKTPENCINTKRAVKKCQKNFAQLKLLNTKIMDESLIKVKFCGEIRNSVSSEIK